MIIAPIGCFFGVFRWIYASYKVIEQAVRIHKKSDPLPETELLYAITST